MLCGVVGGWNDHDHTFWLDSCCLYVVVVLHADFADTFVDSIVIGGNFLHGYSIQMQIEIYQLIVIATVHW